MRRKEFIEKLLAGGLGMAGISMLNEGVAWADTENKEISDIRLHKNIDLDWRFHLGDVRGAEHLSYNDHGWRLLDLPHDWSIEGKFNMNNPSGWHGAYLPGGIGWYRKEFDWHPSWNNKKVSVDFDGIYMNSDVWINGHHLGHRPYGFISFRYDMTPYMKEGRNVIAVRVDNSKQPSARWYTGSGIYRHVWINVTNFIHVGHWGTFIWTPEISADLALVRVQTQVVNDTDQPLRIGVEQIIRGHNGYILSRSEKVMSVQGNSKVGVEQELTISYPMLWSPVQPNMYEMETVLKQGQQVLDRYITPFGIRKLEFSPKWGFRINGVPTLIKGTCNHDDGGGATGAAVPNDVLYRRLKQLKEMGSNAIRTSHNPRSPEFYAFCDALGIMVLNEAFDGWNIPKAKYDYGLFFDKWWKIDLGSFIRRDRNHPSVIMWSIGNEVKGYTNAMQKKLVDFVHKMDGTRPVTQARGWMGPYIDIAGFNRQGEMRGYLKSYYKRNPTRPIIGTEMTHTLQTRGVYRTQTWYRKRFSPLSWFKGHISQKMKAKIYPVPNLSQKEVFTGIPEKYLSSYDNAIVHIDVRDQYKHDSRYSFLMGSFRWSGFDYLGEAINHWPTRSGDYGIIDLSGIPKDHYYLYQSLWSDKPMVHILPHWTHPGKEGVKIPVVVYSNCKRVELFLDEISLGEQSMGGDDLQLVWQVPYQPGKLVAVARNSDGFKLAEAIQETAKDSYTLRINPDKTYLRANRRDVAHLEISVVDKNGIVIPDANNLIYFDVFGEGRLLGVENGDIADMDSTKTNKRKAFHGKCMGLIQSTDRMGTCTVIIRARGLKAQKVQLNIL